jgi:DNA modification methylase/sporulation protein YlmC with PRC-barrel domain
VLWLLLFLKLSFPLFVCFSMKLSQLTPDTRNANKGTPRGRKMVKDSLQRYGAGRSILLDRAGNIIAGNKTVEGAKAIGLEDVQVVKTDGTRLVAVQRTDLDINDRKARELAIADNRAAEVGLEWDVGVLKELKLEEINLGSFWDERELVEFFANVTGEGPVPQFERADALQKAWQTQYGQIWAIPSASGKGKHRLMCGSSTERHDVEQLLAGVAPVLIATDPPYGIELDMEWRDRAGINGSNSACPSYMKKRVDTYENKDMSGDTKADWSDAFELIPSALVIYVWHASKFTREVLNGLERIGFEHFQQIIWNKPIATRTRTHYWYKHEPCWYGRKKNAPWHGAGGTETATVWEATPPKFIYGGSDEPKIDHPTQKPLELFKIPLLNHLDDGGVIYEPFSGSGTCLAAAEITKRLCYAMEIEPRYVAVTLQRLADMGLRPVLDNA